MRSSCERAGLVGLSRSPKTTHLERRRSAATLLFCAIDGMQLLRSREGLANYLHRKPPRMREKQVPSAVTGGDGG